MPPCKGSPSSDYKLTKSWTDCFGTYTYASGSKYVGEWKNGEKHGQGIFTFVDGNKYVGQFKDEKYNGQGIFTFVDGRVKAGIWDKGEFKNVQKGTPSEFKDFFSFLKMLQQITEGKISPNAIAGRSSEPLDATQKKIQRLRKEIARRTQEALQVLGLYSGKLDGIIGVKTRSAIREWQKRNGYSPTGEVTETQLVKLEDQVVARLAKKKSEPPKQVAKKTPDPQPTPEPGTSGSGFFVSKKGHVVTNQHIVNKCKKVTVGNNAQKQVIAGVLETDRRNDLALLKISSLKMASVETKSLIQKLGIKVVPLATDGLLRSEDVDLGEDVLVAGYPYGEIFSDSIKVTKGIISANKGLGGDTGQFQIDAAVQPGNSGGPIYDENGNIVGVVVAQLNKMKFAKYAGSIPENVNFGIKASTVKQFLNSSGLPSSWSKRSKRMSTKDIAKIAKRQTVMVMCHR